MLEDSTRYQQLQADKDNEQKKFNVAQTQIYNAHTTRANEEMKNHTDFIEIQKNQIAQLQQEIEAMMNDNKETMKQINEDADKEIKDIEQKNQSSLSSVHDMGMRSKAELQLTKNKLTDTDSEIDKLER